MQEPCPECSKELELRALVNHLKGVHNFNPDMIKQFREDRNARQKSKAEKNDSIKFKCSACPKFFEHAASVRRHMKDDHSAEKGTSYQKITSTGVENVGNDKFTCEFCNASFTKLLYLMDHVSMEHEETLPDSSGVKIFPNETSWKDWFEGVKKATGTTMFIRRSTHENNVKKVDYRCSRAGKYESVAEQRVATDSKKTELTCSAFTNVKVYEDGSVQCVGLFQHSHEVNIAKIKLSESDLIFLKNEIQKGRTDAQILKDISETCGVGERRYFTTKDDIRNIKQKFGLYEGRLHMDDLESVKNGALSDTNILRYRAPTDCSGSGFALTYVNNIQKQWIEKFSTRLIVVDDTFNTTRYNLKLLTMIVLDEKDMFRPAAFFLTHGLKGTDVAEFFDDLKKLVPDFCPEYIMTDEALSFFNGYKKAFPENTDTTRHLLCQFHIYQSWKRNAKKYLQDPELHSVLSLLHIAMKVKDAVESERAVVKCLSICGKSERGQLFANYLVSNYLESKKLWATCHRLFAPANTSGASESWHSYLKGQCLHRNQSIRVDYLLHILQRSIDEIDKRRFIEKSKGIANRHSRSAQTNRNHLIMSQKFTDVDVRIVQKSDLKFDMYTNEDRPVEISMNRNGCPCSEENAHCKFCYCCAYSMICSCKQSLPGISCAHVHLFHENHGTSRRDIFSSSQKTTVSSSHNQPITTRSESAVSLIDNVETSGLKSTEIDEEYESHLQSSEPGEMLTSADISDICVSSPDYDAMAREALEMIEAITLEIRQRQNDEDTRRSYRDHVGKLTEFAQSMKSSSGITGVMLTRSKVLKNPSAQDDSMRDRLHLTKRKRHRSPTKPFFERVIVDDDNVTVCQICKKSEPNNEKEAISWLACVNCSLWIHEVCGEKQDFQCNLCGSCYEERETLQDK